MRTRPPVTQLYKAVEQSAAGVMALEPPMNWVGAGRQQQAVGALAFPLKTAQVTIETTATVVMQTSNDGVNWVDQDSVSASGEIVCNEVWAYVRLNVSAWTAGAVNATLALSE